MKLKPRVIKIDDRDWERLAVVAENQGSTRPDIIRKAIRNYLRIAVPKEANPIENNNNLQ